ncbi:NAD(P)-dependent oxidoreductase [Kozakia baliensis]|uniref:NAD(P)-dependent oxidoreductase n=1 Tax=Kozakia baliensis TaxID=153496 RepID=UPI000495437D|nr:NAD(P)-dependent oxidoreductase [Kozakia baliensis]
MILEFPAVKRVSRATGLRVINQLGPIVGEALRRAGGVMVADASRENAPWETRDADILLTGPAKAWRDAPQTAPHGWPNRVRWVQVASSGVDGFPSWFFDVPSVTTGRGITADPIAEYVLAAILLDAKRLDVLAAHGPEEYRAPDAIAPLGTLGGKVIGIVGYGAIGQAVARRAQAFDMDILAWHRGGSQLPENARRAESLSALFAQSDIVVLALPLTAETQDIVNAPLLRHAKPGLHLINVARGGLVDQNALLGALDAGQVRFATLDVTAPEPLPAGHSFYNHPAIRLTPHVSWSDKHGRERLAELIVSNLQNLVVGRPLRNLFDRDRGY